MTRVAKMFGVSINNLCRWKRTTERKAGAGRKINNINMENKLLHWIEMIMKNNQGHLLTKKLIQYKAKEWSKNEDFKASKGWLERFVKRNRHLNLHIALGMQLRDLMPSPDSNNACPSDQPNKSAFQKFRRSPRNLSEAQEEAVKF